MRHGAIVVWSIIVALAVLTAWGQLAPRLPSSRRFREVKPGVTQAQVREILGDPKWKSVENTRKRPAIAWGYETDDGASRIVWFDLATVRVVKAW